MLDQAIDREIAAVRTVIKYIAKYKLESEYPPEDLEKQIVELENEKETKIVFTQKKKKKSKGKSNVLIHSLACSEMSNKFLMKFSPWVNYCLLL